MPPTIKVPRKSLLSSGAGAEPLPTVQPAASPAPSSSSLVTEAGETITVECANLLQLTEAIAATTRPWRSLDVFVSVSAPSVAAAALSIFVYAVNKGVRALVASGRVPFQVLSGTVGAKSINAPKWVVAVRGVVAESFEVVAVYQQNGAFGQPVTRAQITVAASNTSGAPPSSVGVVPMGPLLNNTGLATSLGMQGVNGYSPPLLELVSLQAINGSAAARYLHLHDTASGLTPTNGFAPLMAWKMGASNGDGIAVDRIHYRARGVLQLIPSSTLLTTTNVVDCAVSALVR